jgi:putative membrane protein
MLSALFQWLIIAVTLLLIAQLLPGIEISGFGVALLAALVIGLVNILIRPLVLLLTLPINILTLGLFAFIVNALMFALVAWLVPGFEVSGFLNALLGSLLLSLITAITGNLVHRRAAFR